MSENALLGTALALMLVALPLVSVGTWNDEAWLWWTGLVVLAAGALIPPVARYVDVGDGGDNGDGDGDDDNGDD
jgi:hypothetical protein